METILIDSLLVLIVNIPFGYWRANVKKFSLQWILAIHIPVPIIILLRLLTHPGFEWYTFVIFVGCFFLGQQFGSYIYKIVKRIYGENISSCLFMDFEKLIRSKKSS